MKRAFFFLLAFVLLLEVSHIAAKNHLIDFFKNTIGNKLLKEIVYEKALKGAVYEKALKGAVYEKALKGAVYEKFLKGTIYKSIKRLAENVTKEDNITFLHSSYIS